MTGYTYLVKTERDHKGKPKHTYEGERNVTEGLGNPVIQQLDSRDEMAIKIACDISRLMGVNPHISRIEVKVEEIK